MVTWLHNTTVNFMDSLGRFLARREGEAENIAPQVTDIIGALRRQGDAALFDYTARWDRLQLTTQTVRVGVEEIEQAAQTCALELYAALELAAARIADYHQRQLPQDYRYTDAEGNNLGWRWRPIGAVGLYVPGGQAVYPSSVLMNAIPAQVAGVKRLAMVVPAPDGVLNPVVLAAAKVAGITEIYRIGGAQAVAALAYGTASIRPVDKIVGPGNAWVAEAKRQVFGKVGIDMIAGPSEICVVADAANDPQWIAADLLSQAEHSKDAQAILITDDEGFGHGVAAQMERLIAASPRRDIAEASWNDYGAIILVDQLENAAPICDRIAPEHLELALDEAQAEALAAQIQVAGALFLGRHSPEAFGDYVAGPSHVLPTVGTARFSSGLSVYDFLNKQSIIAATESGFQKAGKAGKVIADAEGLYAHALSLEKRLR